MLFVDDCGVWDVFLVGCIKIYLLRLEIDGYKILVLKNGVYVCWKEIVGKIKYEEFDL